MSVALDILTTLRPYFPASHEVLNQRGQINAAQWQRVADQTGDPQVTWALKDLRRPITRADIINLRREDPDFRRRRGHRALVYRATSSALARISC